MQDHPFWFGLVLFLSPLLNLSRKKKKSKVEIWLSGFQPCVFCQFYKENEERLLMHGEGNVFSMVWMDVFRLEQWDIIRGYVRTKNFLKM